MYPMEALTVLNVTDNIQKVILCFVYSLILVPAMVFILIFRYLTILDLDDKSDDLNRE